MSSVWTVTECLGSCGNLTAKEEQAWFLLLAAQAGQANPHCGELYGCEPTTYSRKALTLSPQADRSQKNHP
ncbi:MAG: hypothetical protein J5803_03935 [Desulfovibrio sp.]|nr:hypothetical protein [Desulfovibrio sp.]